MFNQNITKKERNFSTKSFTWWNARAQLQQPASNDAKLKLTHPTLNKKNHCSIIL
jgi:hypothetical protein